MSELTREAMMELMAYADGELEGADKARVEALLATSEDARRVVNAMGTLGTAVQAAYDAPAEGAYASIADRVMEEVAKEGAAPAKKLSSRPPRAIDLRAERERRIKMGAAIIAAISLAAGIVLTTRHMNEQSVVTAGGGAATSRENAPKLAPTAPTAPPASAAAQVATADTDGVDVEQVDSAREVEVFYVPAAAGKNASSVVVWIDDKAGKP